MAQAEAPPKYVQEQLGYSSIQVTMVIYSPLVPRRGREWGLKLGEVLQAQNASQLHPAGEVVEVAGTPDTAQPSDMEGKELVPPIRIECTIRGLGKAIHENPIHPKSLPLERDSTDPLMTQPLLLHCISLRGM